MANINHIRFVCKPPYYLVLALPIGRDLSRFGWYTKAMGYGTFVRGSNPNHAYWY